MGKSTKDPKNVWSVLKQLKPILNKEGLPPLDEMQYHYTKLSLSRFGWFLVVSDHFSSFWLVSGCSASFRVSL